MPAPSRSGNYVGEELPGTGSESRRKYIWDGSEWVICCATQGPKGKKGPTGPTGPSGPSGPSGPTGPVGGSCELLSGDEGGLARTLAAADSNTTFLVDLSGGNVTITLPMANSQPKGTLKYAFCVVCAGNTLRINASGTDVFSGRVDSIMGSNSVIEDSGSPSQYLEVPHSGYGSFDFGRSAYVEIVNSDSQIPDEWVFCGKGYNFGP